MSGATPGTSFASSSGSSGGASSTTVTAGTVTARFRALRPGVVKVHAAYVETPTTCTPVASTAKGSPLELTVKVVPRISGGSFPNRTLDTRPLTSLLLISSELPGYGDSQPSGWMNEDGGNAAPSSMCPSLPLSALASEGYASVTFNPQSNSAPELIEELIRSTSATADFSTMRRTITKCKKFTTSLADLTTSPVPALKMPGTLTPIRFPAYGDQSVAMVQTLVFPKALTALIPTSNIPFQTGSVLIRDGDYLIVLAFFPSSSPFSPGQLVPFVKPALAKLPD